ncbi:unnamed protein product [Orchesella dallaii]|uniref:SET domain-containing protein n=1 Tax=Orchesella dallaii TaxID=48710 RepID=A0ABP1Q3F1_9HEXA
MGKKRGNKKGPAAAAATNQNLKYFESDLFQCDYSPICGRFLKAKVDIKKGTLILKEKPLVAGPKVLSTALCVGCHADTLKTPAKSKCTKCGWPMCTSRCEDSPFHKLDCRLFREKKIDHPAEIISTDYGAIGILRGLLLKLYQPQEWKVFSSLEHNNEIRKKLPIWLENEKYVGKVIREKWGLSETFSEEEVYSACGVYEVNGFEIGDFSKFGAIFPKASMIAHDCIPNAAHYVNEDDSTLEIHALLDIPAGTNITMCYDCSLKGTNVRQRTLFKTKYFTCKCTRCMSPTELGSNFSTLICTANNCKKGQLLKKTEDDEGIWKCSRCPFTMTDEAVDKLLGKYQATVNKSLPNVKAQEEFLQECKSVFHPNHYIPLEVKFNLCMAYGRENGYKLHELSQQEAYRKLELCHEVLKALDLLTPGMTVVRGNILYELQAAEVLICRNLLESGKCSKALIKRRVQNALKTLVEAIQIFEICDPMKMLAENAKATTLIELKGWLNSLK